MRDVSVNETLLAVPRRLILDEHHAEASDVAAVWNTSEPRLPPFLKLALLVLHEAKGGDEALLHPYTQLLPTADDMAYEGGPAWTWTAAELAVTECDKLASDAQAKRQTVLAGQAILEPERLAQAWNAHALPGEPPSADDLVWAVATVTTRWFGGQPLLVPVYDMANHAAHAPNALASFGRDGTFRLVASAPIAQSAQVHVSYGALSSFVSLMMHGFVAGAVRESDAADSGSGGSEGGGSARGGSETAASHASSSSLAGEVIFVRVAALLEAGAADDAPPHADASARGRPSSAQRIAAALESQAKAGRLMRNRFGAIAPQQPEGRALRQAVSEMAAAGALPASMGATPSADDAYAALLRQTLSHFSTSFEQDVSELEQEVDDLPPRKRLALQFRVVQKQGLREALRSVERQAQ